MKKIIYGNSNFRKIKINNNYLYVDKTQYIERLENLNEDFVIFLRSRRFGKSLFLSSLQYYYDENSVEEFEQIFQDTYIIRSALYRYFSNYGYDDNITDVTPITLDSLSNGFNIVSNISHHKEFNAMAGFTQKEVE